jgi:hypothetical protein
MVFLLVWAVGTQIIDSLSWGHDSWQLSEWLINYAGGFVRRGLLGSVIGTLTAATGIQANHLVIVTSLISYLLLTFWFLRRSTKVFPAALLLSGMLMGLPGYQDSIIRKDCLGVLFFLGCLKVENSRFAPATRFILGNLLACIAILSHETFVFYALPAYVLFSRFSSGPINMRTMGLRVFSISPAILCFLITAKYHGDPQIAEAINDSWLPLWRLTDAGNPAIQQAATAIQAVGWTSEKGLSLALNLITSGFYQPFAWLMVFSVSFALVVLFTNRNADRPGSPSMETRIQVAAILVAQLVSISPLFILGVDYGRWLFFWIASSVILYTLGWNAPRWLIATVRSVFVKSHVEAVVHRVQARDWYLLFFGVPVCWNIHSFVFASPVSRHLEILHSWALGALFT